MSEDTEVLSPAFERVTVAPGRSLTVSLLWCDPEGVTHGAAHILPEGSAAEVPNAMVSPLRAEGVIL